ncbi:dehydrodolichyl diphosphate synthase complex subunit DHDDS isoform X1 [Maniola jurtina]|uniref:dehydrodolichyl diphosphate synthase complex subunit DHDDS isoform X1 n=1 Tax=Maniola jurtina TaxID=191418 RepID=UPI001E68DECC|nr:dehydrodolichyl diphosphate synthase complex subunit DHDDS isoform X1 [Maniola jurtina]
MSWVKENCLSFFQLFCIKVVKTGRIPQHLALIMDGNRRYAKKLSVGSTEGHNKGFDKLSEVLKWCLDLGIPEVTVYAFSIENFKRSQDEVDALMELASDKFKRLLEEMLSAISHLPTIIKLYECVAGLEKVTPSRDSSHRVIPGFIVHKTVLLLWLVLAYLLCCMCDQINEWGVRMHVAGRLSLLPAELQALVSKAMLATRQNNKLRLNIAYSYTGRDEISRAASYIIDSVKNKELTADDIDEDLISQTLDLGEPELLVRTSGEVRLSDFMLWQVNRTVLYFTDVLWPEFTIWNLLAAIIHFQRHAPPALQEKENTPIQQEFLEKLETRKWQTLEKIVGC